MQQTTEAHNTIRFSFAGAHRANTLFSKSNIFLLLRMYSMLYNKAAANGSYSWKQEDHKHQLLNSQASYKDTGAILSKRNKRRSGNKYNA